MNKIGRIVATLLVLLNCQMSQAQTWSNCPSPCVLNTHATVTFAPSGTYTMEKDNSNPPNVRIFYTQSTDYSTDAALTVSGDDTGEIGFLSITTNGRQRIAVRVRGSANGTKFGSMKGLLTTPESGTSASKELVLLKELRLKYNFGDSGSTGTDSLRVDDVLGISSTDEHAGIVIDQSAYGVWRTTGGSRTPAGYRGIRSTSIAQNFAGDMIAEGDLGIIYNVVIGGSVSNPANTNSRANIVSPQGFGIWESGSFTAATNATFSSTNGYINRFVVKGNFTGSFAGKLLFSYANGPGTPDTTTFPRTSSVFQVVGDLDAPVTIANGASVQQIFVGGKVKKPFKIGPPWPGAIDTINTINYGAQQASLECPIQFVGGFEDDGSLEIDGGIYDSTSYSYSYTGTPAYPAQSVSLQAANITIGGDIVNKVPT